MVTAPTNCAVSELLRKLIFAIDQHPKVSCKPTDLLLVGFEKKYIKEHGIYRDLLLLLSVWFAIIFHSLRSAFFFTGKSVRSC
jgi:hypothetical protein